MAEQKELRRMNRTELIEIIYALQQQEQDLRRENKELSERLEDRAIRLESSGSIAEAALSLSHIFEDAQTASDLYLMSIQEQTEPGSSDEEDAQDEDAIQNEARQTTDEAQRILDEAQAEAGQIIDAAKDEADDEAQRILDEAQAEADRIVDAAKDKASDEAQSALDRARKLVEDAKRESEQIINIAYAEADKILASTQAEAGEIRRRGKQAAANERDKFLHEVMRLLDENPELAEALRERARREDGV